MFIRFSTFSITSGSKTSPLFHPLVESSFCMHLILIKTRLSAVEGFDMSHRTNSNTVPSFAPVIQHFCFHCVDSRKSASFISICTGPTQTPFITFPLGIPSLLLTLFSSFVSFACDSGTVLSISSRILDSRFLKCWSALVVL